MHDVFVEIGKRLVGVAASLRWHVVAVTVVGGRLSLGMDACQVCLALFVIMEYALSSNDTMPWLNKEAEFGAIARQTPVQNGFRLCRIDEPGTTW